MSVSGKSPPASRPVNRPQQVQPRAGPDLAMVPDFLQEPPASELFGLFVFFGECDAKQLKKADIERVKRRHKQQHQERCQHQAKGEAGSHRD